MILTICLKEIRGHLKSPFFFIGMALVTFLTAYATVIGLNDYRQRSDDCLAARSDMEKSAYRYYVFREPNPMSVFVQGYDTRAGTTAALYSNRIPVKTTGYMGIMGTSQAERYDTGFLSIDYAFVVRVVLSLLVIFLVFGVIAGDRQRGTLKLTLANPIPRDTVLLGKLLGGWLVVTALLTVTSVVSLVLALISPDVRAGTDVVLRFLGIYVSSVLYLTVFFTMGLWISVLINRPSTVLITLLVTWVTVTSIVPTLGCLAAERLVPPPGEERLQSMRAEVLKPDEDYDKARDEWLSLRPDNPAYIPARDKVLDIDEKRALQLYDIDRIWVNGLDRQASFAVLLTLASPAAVYDQAIMGFTGTSSGDYDRFLDYIRTTWNTVCKANRMHFRDRKESKKILDSIEPFHPGDTRPDLLKATLFLGILGFSSILFFALAYTGFLRKDVR
jgi:ABC-type transport system involved in multi-copper enzyme maturation permease subunit